MTLGLKTRDVGLQQAFETLVSQHRGVVFKVAHTYCRNPEDQRDLAQEIYTQLWRAFPAYDDRRRFSTWMYRIALNVAISYRRSASYRERLVESVDDATLATFSASVTREPDARVGDLYRVIDQLDDLHRALVLLYLEGRDYAETADILGISETNVATKLSRLKLRLRKTLTEPQSP
jgi:RNA polymerase sigma-70 factor, ECF subfamily